MSRNAPTPPITRDEVIAAASTVLDTKLGEALPLAEERGWLDGDGEPSEEGRKVVRALREQKNTRSTFR